MLTASRRETRLAMLRTAVDAGAIVARTRREIKKQLLWCLSNVRSHIQRVEEKLLSRRSKVKEKVR